MEIYMYTSVHIFKEYAYIHVLDMIAFYDYNGLGVFYFFHVCFITCDVLKFFLVLGC